MHMRLQRGQALILIALAFLGLVAFIGLTVDAGILFIQIGHLRRAVDAAGLAAASQYLSTTTESQLLATMKEFLKLNGIDPEGVPLYPEVCNLSPPSLPQFPNFHEPSLCKENNPWDYDRKLIRVKAELTVNFAFLPVIGLRSVNIKAETIAEAASLDLVLVIDTSMSMADEGGDLPDCNLTDTCYPFHNVRASALRFVKQLAFPFDHVAIVHFDKYGELADPPPLGDPIHLTENQSDIEDAINSLWVYKHEDCPTAPNLGGCLSTNIDGGLREAAAELAANGRPESLWVVVLLSDGAANQARDEDTGDWICPHDPAKPDDTPEWILPFCRDGDGDSRHPYGEFWYDVDDAARDKADFLGCYQDTNKEQSNYCFKAGIDGCEALIFTIGMGDRMVSGDCDQWYADHGETCHEDLGERLLRYIAAVGDDGDPESDLCDGKPQKTNCGNYYFAETALDLDPVFADIAKRVYTRITH